MRLWHFRYTPVIAGAFLLTVLSIRPVVAAGDKPTGAIFTTTADGTIINANTQYDSKCAVYLDGGPGPNAPPNAAGLPAGDYYFQVTDPSGKILLSTDPVSNRRFTVSADGVIVAYSGVGGPVHPTGLDQDHQELGAITIRLANVDCPADFLNTVNDGGVYKVWATPVSAFVGDPTQVDPGYSAGNFHGFIPSRSKTDNFKARASVGTLCFNVVKKILANDDTLSPGANWLIQITNPEQVTNDYYTDEAGNLRVCSLGPGTYTVSEDTKGGTYFAAVLYVNGVEQEFNRSVYSFELRAGDPETTIEFHNRRGE